MKQPVNINETTAFMIRLQLLLRLTTFILGLMLAILFFFVNLEGMTTCRFVVLLLVVILGIPPCLAQEHTTGIFATIHVAKKSKAKGYGRTVFNRTNREKFLIPEIPLITSAEFVAVSDIVHDSKTYTSHVSITVTAAGLEKLRNAVQSLSNIELILLIDNIVFGRISSKGEDDFRFNKITIVTPFQDANLEWAHQKLAEMISSRKQE